MTAASDRLPRLLALVPYLLQHPDTRLADAAADFEVSEQQLRKDLQLLWMCGLPGYGPGDLIDLAWGEDDTISVTHDAGISRPLRLTADEALAVIVALRTLADVPGLSGRAAIDRALAKLEHAAGAAAEASERVAVQVEAQEQTLAAVQSALEQHRALHLTYYTAGRDETTERDVDPMRVVFVEGRTYLEAWCRSAEGVRMFRLDRIDDLQVLDEPASPPPQAQPVDLGAGVFQASAAHHLVVLRLSPAARWVAEFYPHESVEEQPDGDLVVRLRVADLSWARRLLLGLGPAATVIEPSALAAEVRAEAQAALAAYED